LHDKHHHCVALLQRVPVGEVLPGDIDLHREIAKTIENPLYLLLDTTDGAGVRDLPVQMLESEVHTIFLFLPLIFSRCALITLVRRAPLGLPSYCLWFFYFFLLHR